MTFFRSFLLFGAATALLGQTPPPAQQTPPNQAAPPMPQVKLSVENPQPPKPPDVPPDKVVLQVGDTKLTAAEFDKLIDALLTPQYRATAHGAGRRQFADNIVQVLT